MAIGTGHRVEDIAQDLFEVVTQICLSSLRGRRRSGDLKEVEFLTLSLLHAQGTMIVGDIQRLLGVLPAQMSRVIRALENRSQPLIVCRINPRDKRKIDVQLTESGEKALTDFQAIRVRRIAEQLHETARHRSRQIDALAVQMNHIHLVFGTVGDPDPDTMLGDWKAYCSRALNRMIGWTPPDPRPVWWERDGSKRVCPTSQARANRIRYVRDQEKPLVVWLSTEAEQLLIDYPSDSLNEQPEGWTPPSRTPQ